MTRLPADWTAAGDAPLRPRAAVSPALGRGTRAVDESALDIAVGRFRWLVTMCKAYRTDDERRLLLTRGRVAGILDEYDNVLRERRGAAP